MSIRGAKQYFKPGQKADRFRSKVVSPAKDPSQPAASVTEAAASHPFPVVGVNSLHRSEP
jgi:hypothetical protein